MSPLERIGGEDGPVFTFLVDDTVVSAPEGETIAVALLAADRRALGVTVKRREPRGLYCVMGVCWECAVVVDGRTVRACVTLARPGLRVETLGAAAGPSQ